MSGRRRRLLLLAGLFLSAAAFWADRRRYVTVFIGRLPSGFLFLSEDTDHPGLRALRRDQGLDRVVAGAPDSLERLERLALWSSIQFPMTTPFPHYPPWDANAILTLYQRRVTGDFCAQYAILLGQAAQSLGYMVRYFDLAEVDTKASHFIVSIYVPELRKWVAFEPTEGFFYQDASGRPLGVLEIHRALMARRFKDVRNSLDGKPVRREHLELFDRFRVYLRNNFLTLPVRVARIPHPDGLEYKFEPYRLTWIGDLPEIGDPRFQSRRSEDLETGWDPASARDASIESRRGFKRFYEGMEDGVLYRVRLPRSLLSALLDSWINDPRYEPLAE